MLEEIQAHGALEFVHLFRPLCLPLLLCSIGTYVHPHHLLKDLDELLYLGRLYRAFRHQMAVERQRFASALRHVSPSTFLYPIEMNSRNYLKSSKGQEHGLAEKTCYIPSETKY